MSLESLPDELLLLIFCYLHKFEILYAFTNLHQRFQQIIEPYSYNIDLTHRNKPCYRHFQCFCQHILPLNGQNVRSLQLSGNQQLQFFQPHICWLTNLESLVIEEDKECDIDDFSEEKQFLIGALSIPSLSELSIFPVKHGTLRTIASCASHNLTTLTSIFDRDIPNFGSVPQMSSVKRLYINLWSFKAVVQLFKIMPNLKELNLSILRFKKCKGFDLIEVPQTLEKLHLEFGGFHYSLYQPSFEFIKQFLNAFKNQLRSLTLIFINAVEDFSNYDKLQSLVKNFNRLETFEYYIHTIHQPNSPSFFPNVEHLQDLSYTLYTLPRPQQFDTISSRTEAFYSFGLGHTPRVIFNYQSLCVFNVYYCETLPTTFELKTDLRLVNMKQIHLDLFEDLQADARRFLSKVIAHSPNLTRWYTGTKDTKNLIKQMFEIIPVKQKKQITYFDLSLCCSVGNWTFFSELSTILPNSKTLKIYLGTQVFDNCFISLTELVRDLRSYFRKLSRLIIELRIRDENTRNAFERYKNELDELSQQTTKNQSLYYIVKVHDDTSAFLSIWL